MPNIVDKVKAIEDDIINFRRDLHENPELSGKEFRTQKMLMKELDKLGISYKKVGNTSLIASIKGKTSGNTVALRADMDALPIYEETDLAFKSKNHGVMHACGHDTHTAMLLGAAKILSEIKDEINGEVRFFFQEGEETFSGAKKIIKAGGMEGVDACFGIHGMPDLETGFVSMTPGYRMAGCDTIYVKFEGISGHASAPHLAKDTIHPACVFVTELQSIVTKKINSQDPIVISVGKFVGGTKANIISKYTEIEISMRYFNAEARDIAHESIKRHAKGIADIYQLKADVKIEESALSLYNDEELALIADKSSCKVLGEGKNIEIARYMGSDDVSCYFQYAKGIYAFLGYRNVEKGAVYFPHHEKFMIDEDYMKYGTALHVQFVLDYLNETKEKK